MKTTQILLILGLLASSLSSCTYTKEKTEQEQLGPEYTSAYVCPMHCEGSGAAEAGTCPISNMVYVPNEDLN